MLLLHVDQKASASSTSKDPKHRGNGGDSLHDSEEMNHQH